MKNFKFKSNSSLLLRTNFLPFQSTYSAHTYISIVICTETLKKQALCNSNVCDEFDLLYKVQ